MESPSSCVRCRRPLATQSDSGLCATCRVYAGPPHNVPDALPLSPADDTVRQTHVPPDPHQPAAPPGYDLVRRIGCGGMGDVFLARELSTERAVAMKFLWCPTDRSAHDRFLVEVRALAKVEHPNIVRVLSADIDRREPYFTMEYADGGSLGRRVEAHGPLAAREAAAVARTVAGALAAAHAAGVIHRDVKPSNILLSGDRSQETGVRKQEAAGVRAGLSPDSCPPTPDFGPLTPRLSDFGLAKRLDRDDGLSISSGGMGTPGYMPPEQVSSRFGDLGPASDVYGLGATLFHLLTGRAPFRGGTAADVTARVVSEPAPRVRALAPAVPRELEAIVAKCLEKKAADRYPTAAALADDLGRFLDGRAPHAPLLSWRRRAYRTAVRHRVRLAGAGAAVAALLAVGFVAARPADPFAAARRQINAGKVVTLVGETALPKYHRAALGNAVPGKSDAGDGTGAFTSIGHALTELVPDPGCDSYRFTVELRQLKAGSQLQPSIERIGLYFGYAEAVVGSNPVHLMQAVRFNDYDFAVRQHDPDAPKQRLMFGTFAGVERPEQHPFTAYGGSNQVPFEASVEAFGRWRMFVVEASPFGVTVKWRTDAGDLVPAVVWPTDKCRQMWDDAKQRLEKHAPGASAILPEWHPRRAIGVLTYSASVAVRNATLEPIP